MNELEQDVLEIPNYSPVEAVRYFHVPFSTLRYWTEEPNALVQLASVKPKKLLSFKNMAEFYVLEGLRVAGVRTPKIREAIHFMLEKEQSRHPLADYDLETDGKYVFFLKDGFPITNASRYGQYEMRDVISRYLHRVKRSPSGIAERIYPFMKREQLDKGQAPPETVEINPAVCFGLPVLAGTRITTGFLASCYRGGDSVPELAKSYGRSVAEVKEAIEWETGREITLAAA